VPELHILHERHGRSTSDAGSVSYLDAIGKSYGRTVRTPIGWLLPGLIDPDDFEVRFYTSDSMASPSP
jgi:hypothetical protein